MDSLKPMPHIHILVKDFITTLGPDGALYDKILIRASGAGFASTYYILLCVVKYVVINRTGW